MKYVRILGLLAVAASALMAFASTASAATLTSPTGTTYTGTITATSTHTVLHGSFTDVTCTHSHMEGTVAKHGASTTVSGPISTLTFTGGCNVTVKKAGSLELHAIKSTTPHETCASGTYCTGTLTSSGAEVVVHTSVGECVFTTSNTSLGTVTPTNDTGGAAIFHIAATIPRTGGSFLCGASGIWTGTYTVSTPSTLWIDE